MVGLGYRREMADWDMSAVDADFFEVAPENWIRRDRWPLQRLRDSGRAVHLHGVSLNLAGQAPIDQAFVRQVGELMDDLGLTHYSDHLAASGDAHPLYELFPTPWTSAEVCRVADRIAAVQDCLGRQIAVENVTWYTRMGDMPEAAFIAAVVDRADCRLLLDINNIAVNHKNHGTPPPQAFVAALDLARVTYVHVAGHEYDARFDLYLDTHSQAVEAATQTLARGLMTAHGLPVLLEWDNDVPDLATLNRELSCLKRSLTT